MIWHALYARSRCRKKADRGGKHPRKRPSEIVKIVDPAKESFSERNIGKRRGRGRMVKAAEKGEVNQREANVPRDMALGGGGRLREGSLEAGRGICGG